GHLRCRVFLRSERHAASRRAGPVEFSRQCDLCLVPHSLSVAIAARPLRRRGRYGTRGAEHAPGILRLPDHRLRARFGRQPVFREAGAELAAIQISAPGCPRRMSGHIRRVAPILFVALALRVALLLAFGPRLSYDASSGYVPYAKLILG